MSQKGCDGLVDTPDPATNNNQLRALDTIQCIPYETYLLFMFGIILEIEKMGERK